MKYKEIIFDIDGTMIDTQYAMVCSLLEALEIALGKRLTEADVDFAFGLPADESLTRLQVPDVDEARELWDERMRQYKHLVKYFDGIPEVIKQLSEAGYGLGIVTSKNKEEVEQDFARFDIYPYFTTIISTEYTERHKPYPDPIWKYMELTGTNPQEVLYIGDSVYDIQCAKDAGVDFVLAGWGAKNIEIPEDIFHAKHPLDILGLL